MSRSIWKGPFSLKRLSKQDSQKDHLNIKEYLPIFIRSRNSTILPEYIGKKVEIHNGKSWTRRVILEDMVGHKFGEFSYTKKKTIHKITGLKKRK